MSQKHKQIPDNVNNEWITATQYYSAVHKWDVFVQCRWKKPATCPIGFQQSMNVVIAGFKETYES